MKITDDQHRRGDRQAVIDADFPFLNGDCRADEFQQGVLFAGWMRECYEAIKALLQDSFWPATADARESMRAEMDERGLTEIGVLQTRYALLRRRGALNRTNEKFLAAVAFSINLEKQAESALVADIDRSMDDANN